MDAKVDFLKRAPAPAAIDASLAQPAARALLPAAPSSPGARGPRRCCARAAPLAAPGAAQRSAATSEWPFMAAKCRAVSPLLKPHISSRTPCASSVRTSGLVLARKKRNCRWRSAFVQRARHVVCLEQRLDGACVALDACVVQRRRARVVDAAQRRASCQHTRTHHSSLAAAAHQRALAWRVACRGEPGRLRVLCALDHVSRAAEEARGPTNRLSARRLAGMSGRRCSARGGSRGRGRARTQ